jgi:hypothetical protein
MSIPAPQGVGASGLPAAGDQANAVLSGAFTAVGPSQPFAFRGPANLSIWNSVKSTLTTTAGSTAATVASATGLATGDAINSVNVPRGTTMGVLAGANITLAIPAITLPGFTSTAAAQITGLPDTTGLLGATVTGPGIPAATTVVAILAASVPTFADPGGGSGPPGGSAGTVQLSAVPTSAKATNDPQMFTFARTGNAIQTTGADANATYTGAAVNYVGTIQLERSFDGGATWIVANIGGSGTLAQWTAGTPVSLSFGEPEKQTLYRLNCTAYTSGTINYRISQTGGAAESLAIGPLTNG